MKEWLSKAIKYLAANMGFYFALFVTVWLVAWTCNAIYKTGFDLGKLEELAKYILGKYITDSGLNTKIFSKEEKPL